MTKNVKRCGEALSKAADDTEFYADNFTKHFSQADKSLNRLASGLEGGQSGVLGSLDQLQVRLGEYSAKFDETFSVAQQPAEDLQKSLCGLTDLVGRLQEGFSKLSPEQISLSVDALRSQVDGLAQHSEKQLRLIETNDQAQVKATENAHALSAEIKSFSVTIAELNGQLGESFRRFEEHRKEQDALLFSILDRLDQWTVRMNEASQGRRPWWRFWGLNRSAA